MTFLLALVLAGATIKVVAPVLNECEMAMLASVNMARTERGLQPLVIDVTLQRSARRHCAWMVRHRSMRHSSGYAENVATGQRSAHRVMRAWMVSPRHRRNILSRNHCRIGLTGYVAPNGRTYWCQQFGRCHSS